MIHQDDFIQFLIKEEAKGDCWALQLNGVYIWPLVRVCAYFSWRDKHSSRAEIEDTGLEFQPHHLPGQLAVKGSARKRIMLISRDDGLNDRVNGKLFDKFISSVRVLFESDHEITVISLKAVANRFDPVVDVSSQSEQIAKSVKINVNQFELNLVKKYLAYFYRTSGLTLSIDAVLDSFIHYVLGYHFWSGLLKQTKPDLVISTCYYIPFLVGACSAAKEKGINFVDLQHGRVGSNHPVMSNWNFEKARIEVSRLFPSQFWCWTKENAENIKKTWKSAEHVCEARVFGNPWQFVRAHQIIKQINDVGIQKAKHAVTVMIALQPIEESLPSFFIEAMNKFSNLDIWIRPHPHQLGGLAEIEKSLRQAGLKNFCIRTGQDLYTDFGYVDLLVTAFSTVATEAMDFGIPVILTHPNSRSAFYGLIDSEKLFYCGNLKESVATISNILKSSRTKDVFEPAKTDFEQMSSCFLQGC